MVRLEGPYLETWSMEIEPFTTRGRPMWLGQYISRIRFLGDLDKGVRFSLITNYVDRLVSEVPITVRAVYPRCDGRFYRNLQMEFNNRTGNFIRLDVLIRYSKIVE